MRGTLDAVLDSATDPLTYVSLGTDALLSAAGRIASNAPHIIDAFDAASSAATNVLGTGLEPAAVGVGRLEFTRSSAVTDLAKLESRVSADVQKVRGSYAADEAAGGHTVKMHIGLSDSQLRTRLKIENRQAVSTFSTEACAAKATGKLKKGFAREINDWLKDSSPGSYFSESVDVRSTIGRVLAKGADRSDTTSVATFVLRRDDSTAGYHIYTAFPVKK